MKFGSRKNFWLYCTHTCHALMHAHIHWNVHTQAPGAPRYYTAISDYNPGDSDVNGISLSEDQEVEVIGINQYGWWWVRATNYFTHDVEEGWVPASYLQVSVDQTVPPSWWSQLLVLKFLVELNLKWAICLTEQQFQNMPSIIGHSCEMCCNTNYCTISFQFNTIFFI